MTERKKQISKQWNIKSVPAELDKEVRLHLIENDITKLNEFVIEAVKEKLAKGNSNG